MYACEPGQVRNQAAISSVMHVPRECPPRVNWQVTHGVDNSIWGCTAFFKSFIARC